MPKPNVAQMRLEPSAVDTRSFALDVQVGGAPGAPGASESVTSSPVRKRWVVEHTAINKDRGAGHIAGLVGRK